MKKCSNCNKRWLCKKEQENICEDYEKEPYMLLVKAEGEIKIFERID